MLIDLHAHSSAISHCCKIPVEDVIDHAKRIGIDGIALTNHYNKAYIKDGDARAFAKRYIAEYHHALEAAKNQDFTVIYGIELTMSFDPAVHILIFGAGEDFALDHPEMYDYSMEKLSALVHERGGVVIQAHPYRNMTDRLQSVSLLDGVELSCHPLYCGTHRDELVKIAHDNGLILTCGGDYHADARRAHCGVYLPDDITDGRKLADFLKSTDSIKLCIQEVTEEKEYYDFVFHRYEK